MFIWSVVARPPSQEKQTHVSQPATFGWSHKDFGFYIATYNLKNTKLKATQQRDFLFEDYLLIEFDTV
jgi:hypothetical protein